MTQEQLFASFILDQHSGIEIALPAEHVVEALPVKEPIKRLPSGADFLEGVMSLRQSVIPVVNLKKRFHLQHTDYAAEAKVAVVQQGQKQYGLLFDDIKDVFRVSQEAIEQLDPFLLGENPLVEQLIKLQQGTRTLELLNLKQLFPGTTADTLAQSSLALVEGCTSQRCYEQFVLFLCRGQMYGIPVIDIQEICFFHELDTMFKSGLIEGALQLRGNTIPVLCGASLLDCRGEKKQPGEDTRILVLAAEQLHFGLIVDRVFRIQHVATDAIMSVPGGHLPHIRGIHHSTQYDDIVLFDVMELINSQVEKIKAMTRLRSEEKKEVKEQVATARHIITENCYLVFSIGKHFAIELKDVQEILDCGNFMSVTHNAGLIQGLINLRGQVVPVLDLASFYYCQQDPSKEGQRKLIIGRANGNLVALLVDEIMTIYKQERFHVTPSLRPELQEKSDTLDRLIEFINDSGLTEHVLVVNVAALLRNYLRIPDQESPVEKQAAGTQDQEEIPHT